jgi:uncharacterized protein YcnI/copper(I)-binding protein
MNKVNYAVVAGLFAAAFAGNAQAHVTFANASAKPGATTVLQLQVPHGCDGKATTELRVTMPAGFYGAKPQPKPGWDLEVIKGDYAKPGSDHGKPVTSGTIEVRWKNGNLSDDFYDTFVIQGKVDGVAEGASLAFPTIQICGADTARWDQVAAPGTDAHSLPNPAPTLKISATGAGAAGHDMSMMAMPGEGMKPATAGALKLSAGFVKAMLPGQPVGGGYVTIDNSGSADDRLVSASSPLAGTVELHEMAMVGDVMKMRRVDGGIALPAGKTTELKPGGLHIMFMKVKEPFKEGAKVPVTLTFEKAGAVDVVLPVGSASPDDHKHD